MNQPDHTTHDGQKHIEKNKRHSPRVKYLRDRKKPTEKGEDEA